MNNKNFSAYDICLMAFLSVFSMFAKPLVAPAFNLITDFARIPGGSVTAGFSVMFLAAAAAITGKKGTAFLMGVLQASMALIMGFSAQAGIMVYITYTLPGIAVDAAMACPLPLKIRMPLACACGVLAGAVMSNILYFNLQPVPFILFYSLGIASGVVCGTVGCLILERLPSAFTERGRV